jgi:hypothetical protein
MSVRVYLILLLGLLAGCQSIEVKDQQSRLEETLRTYSGTIRWGNLADAYNFLEPKLARQSDPPGNLANIRVTRYEDVGSPVLDGESATQVSRIRYIHNDRQVVREITDKQLWRFHKDKGWLRGNPMPAFD